MKNVFVVKNAILPYLEQCMRVQVRGFTVSIVIMNGWLEVGNITKTENDAQKNDRKGNPSNAHDYHQIQTSIEIRVSLHRLLNRLQISVFSLYHRYSSPQRHITNGSHRYLRHNSRHIYWLVGQTELQRMNFAQKGFLYNGMYQLCWRRNANSMVSHLIINWIETR